MSDPVEANDEAPMGIEATTIFDTTGQKDLSQKVQENIGNARFAIFVLYLSDFVKLRIYIEIIFSFD